MDNIQYTKKGTIRKRAPKKKIDYFTKDTENAILAYVATDNLEEKNNIYNKSIKYAFFKLTENIIHTYKFYHTDVDNIEDLQQEIIVFLLEKLHLYKQDKGKAYSYFGTIVKRYLINYGNNVYKKKINKIDISDISKNEEKTDNRFVFNIQDHYEKENRLDFFDLFTEYVSSNLKELFPITPKESKNIIKNYQIADIILDLFRKKDAITIFNKKALYHNIKEMMHISTGVEISTTQITLVSSKLQDLYKKLYIKYQNCEYPFDKITTSVFI